MEKIQVGKLPMTIFKSSNNAVSVYLATRNISKYTQGFNEDYKHEQHFIIS